jgi:hypothetical protein
VAERPSLGRALPVWKQIFMTAILMILIVMIILMIHRDDHPDDPS